MNKVVIPIFAALILTSVVGNAEPFPRGTYTPKYQVKWQFFSTTCVGGVCAKDEDYSTNLAVPRAVTLPLGLVMQGWSCVRLPVEETKDAEYGYFRCSNAATTQESLAQCSLTQPDKDFVWFALSWQANGGKEVNVTLKSKCESQQVQ